MFYAVQVLLIQLPLRVELTILSIPCNKCECYVGSPLLTCSSVYSKLKENAKSKYLDNQPMSLSGILQMDKL